MTRNRRTLTLKCLVAAVTIALLTAPAIQAANSRPQTQRGRATEPRSLTAAQRVEPKPVQPISSGKSYFWSDAAIVGGVLAGILVLGLWGDLAISGAIVGIQLLCAGVAIATRKASAARAISSTNWSRSPKTSADLELMDGPGGATPSPSPDPAAR